MSTDAQLVIKKPKYDGRTKKRKWEERRSDKGTGLYPEKKTSTEPYVRIKKRKYAMLLGYSGVDYYGMQRNPSTRTIEEDLFQALLKSELITQEAFDQIQTIQYQRAARTDKGVSAARQVVSIKLPEEVDISKVNELLPDQINVFAIKRVTKGFNSKSQCDARTYTYMLPTVTFAKSDDTTVTQESFRLSDNALKEINQVLSNFLGTKNFHNFTSKKKHNDPSAKRYIFSFKCEPPFIRKGVEFVILKVKGQSFMLHQIRKMVGLVIAVIKGYIPFDMMVKAWTPEKINIPRAPGLGLVLDFVHYDNYNYRYGTDGIHDVLEWNEVEDSVNDFKEKFIYPTIIDTEIKDQVMLSWLSERLSTHNFDGSGNDGKCSDDEHSSEEESDKGTTEGSKELSVTDLIHTHTDTPKT
ncbi:hypothetical protein RN001_001866 [Aquatica leii]|uniref:Pseudouridylate synthase 1 homolog n=1 Tax=Aquatica leii TaxID=1421715 RepID=A0AAN7PCH6_9COLE|nr:hypothetical protein RN001_001866 [Aquatica leii]